MSKSLVRNAQSILKELGHDISIGHCHELFSRLQGYPSHNHNREKTPFVMPKEGEFSVKIVSEVTNIHDYNIEVKRYINVKASSQEEAEIIISEKLKDDDYIEELIDDLESWEVIWLCAPMEVQNFKKQL